LEAVLKENGFIKNEDIRKIMRVSVRQATRIASRLVAAGWLRSEGYLKTRRYFPVK
jgi:Mn-dependent DtxR family transcriptional regulator